MEMRNPIVLIGVGEIGGVFARGFLKSGYPIVPVVRGQSLQEAADETPDPAAVVVAAGEKDIHMVLDQMPLPWQNRLVLVQNELLPRDWQSHKITNPTVISVWFEKKSGQDVKVIIPSPVFGPHSALVQSALKAVNIECDVVKDEGALLFELILKNLYILTVNIAGLEVGGTVGELWGQHQELARAVAGNVLDIQFKLAGQEMDRTQLMDGMVRAFNGDLQHKCMGRSAPARLERAVEQADEFGFDARALRQIYKNKVGISAA